MMIPYLRLGTAIILFKNYDFSFEVYLEVDEVSLLDPIRLFAFVGNPGRWVAYIFLAGGCWGIRLD